MTHKGSLTAFGIILNHGYRTHTTESVRGLYGVIAEGVLGIQVRHVCEVRVLSYAVAIP